MADLHERTRFDPTEAEPRILERWLSQRSRAPRTRGIAGRELLDRGPAAERHGRPAHGPRAQRLDPGHAHPHQPDARPAGEVDPRHRPRRDRDAAPGREAAHRGGDVARGARPRGVRAARLGVARGARRPDHRAVQAPRRDARLRGRALHDGRGVRHGGPEGLRRPLRAGPHLPRLLHGQLGSRAALGDLRPRGRGARGRGRHAVLDRLPAGLRRRRARRRDRAPGDDARRHRRRGAPRRRALRRARRPGGRPAARRPAPADHRRRVRQDRLRHRRAEDHAGPRPQRLRDRAPSRAAGDRRHRRGRAHDRRRRRRLRGADRRRGAGARRRRPRGAGARARARGVRPHRALQPALGRARRAAHLAAVVHADGRARRPGDRGRPRRPRPDPPRVAVQALPRLAVGDPAVVHLAPAVVGSPDPGLVPRRRRSTARPSRPRARAGSRIPTSSTRGSPRRCGRSRRSAGPRTRPICGRSIRPTCCRPRATSCFSGSRGWS